MKKWRYEKTHPFKAGVYGSILIAAYDVHVTEYGVLTFKDQRGWTVKAVAPGYWQEVEQI